MTTNRGIDETIVRLVEDRQSRQKLQRGLRDVIADIRGVGTAADQALDRRFARSVSSARKELRRLSDDAKVARKAIADIPEPDLFPGERRGGGAGKAIGRFGTQLRGLPAIPLGGGLTTETPARVLQGFSGLDASFAQVGTAALIAAPAVIGLKLALDNFNATVRASETVLRDVVNARREVAKVTADGTRDEVEVARQTARERFDIIQAELRQLTADRAALTAQASEQGLLGRALVALNAGPLGEVNAAIDELKGELAATETQVKEYDRALQENATALADSIALERARQRALDDSIKSQLSLQRQFATTNDTSIIDARLKQLAAEKELIKDTLASANLSEDAAKELNTELVKVSSEISTLALSIRPLVVEREKEAEAVNKVLGLIGGIGKGILSFGERLKEVQEAGRKIQDLREDFSDKLADIERRRAEKIEDAERDLTDKLAEIRRDASNDVAEVERDAQLDRVDTERDHQRELARIRRRSLVDEQNAIQNRDAVALEAARARRDEEVRTENEDAEERKAEIERNLSEQRRTIDRALKEQTRLAHLRYSQQVRDAGIAAKRSIEVEREKFRAEEQIRIAAYQQALGIEIAGETARNQAVAQGVSDRYDAEKAFANAAVNLWQNARAAIFGGSAIRNNPLASSVNVRPPSVRSRSGPLEFHQGGVMPYDGLAVLKRGEVVTNPMKGQSAPGGMTLHINFSGATVRTIQTTSRQETLRQLDEFLVGMGAA